jgi:hypothetical protein
LLVIIVAKKGPGQTGPFKTKFTRRAHNNFYGLFALGEPEQRTAPFFYGLFCYNCHHYEVWLKLSNIASHAQLCLIKLNLISILFLFRLFNNFSFTKCLTVF